MQSAFFTPGCSFVDFVPEKIPSKHKHAVYTQRTYFIQRANVDSAAAHWTRAGRHLTEEGSWRCGTKNKAEKWKISGCNERKVLTDW
eukprot:6175484-Pleurochrysis_carterae.AAC.1